MNPRVKTSESTYRAAGSEETEVTEVIGARNAGAFYLLLVEHTGMDGELAAERFRAVIESVPNGLIMVDPDGQILLFNCQAEELFGYRRTEVAGKPIEILLPERYQQAHGGMRQSFFSNPSARPMGAGRDLFGLRKDGTEFPVEIGLNPVETPEGTMVLAAVIDISERKQAEQQLLDYSRELEHSNQELERFASAASHDLREPLRKITAFSQRLRATSSDALDERSLDYLDRMSGAAERMQVLISDLLTFSRVSSDTQTFAECDLANIAREAQADLDVALEESGGRIEIGELPRILCNASQLRRVFFNLFANALKFRKPGVAPVVRVGARCATGLDGSPRWTVSIADNGIGMRPEHQEAVFEIFHRLHGRSEYPGTGIGLSICRKIIERHGGSIRFEHSPGDGATVMIELAERPPTGQTPSA